MIPFMVELFLLVWGDFKSWTRCSILRASQVPSAPLHLYGELLPMAFPAKGPAIPGSLVQNDMIAVVALPEYALTCCATTG